MAVNNITNLATQAQTEEEKLRKQNTQLPYLQGTNQTQPVTLTPNAGQTPQPQQTQLQPMAPQVPQNQALQTASQVSTQQATQPSAMQQMINQKATDLMQNPTQGFDQQAYKQGQLSSYDLQNAKMYEALRQKNAGIADSGIWQSESLQNQVDSLRNRGELERKIDYENRDFNIESAINAMTQGLKAEGQSQSTIDNAVKNLVSTYEAQNPERTSLIGAQSEKNLQESKQDFDEQQADLNRRAAIALQSGDIAGQKEIEALKSDLTLKQMASKQDWEGVQKELDRRSAIALQSNDINAQKDIEKLKSDLTLQQMASEQNWSGVQKELDRRNELALQTNDINSIRTNLMTQIEADKQAQAAGQVFTAEQNAMNRILETSLKTMDIDSARALIELKGKVDSGMMLQEQDWKSAESELGRLHDLAVQQGDIKGQKDIEMLRGEIENAKQKSQQDWQTAERISSQVYSSTERVDQNSANLVMKKFELEGQKAMQMQEFANSLNMMDKEFSQEEYMAKLQSKLEEARADNDYVRTEALTKLQSALQAGLQDDAQLAAKELAELETTTQKFIQQQNAELQLKMQTNGFSQDERNKQLDFMYQEAKASNDVNRQKEVLTYQQKMNAMDMAEKYGYDSSLAYINEGIQKALQDNDFENAEALQNARIKVEVDKLAQEKTFEQARIDLQARGVDMAEVEQQYAQIQNLVEQNILPESALMDYATKTLKANGVDTSSYKMVDKQKAAEQALQQEYELQKKQFVQTHPEYTPGIADLSKAPFETRKWLATNGYDTVMDKYAKGQNPTTQDLTGIPIDILKTIPITSTGAKELTSDGLKAMNEYINNALYGEETTDQKTAKANAGYLNESDLENISAGDKFSFNADVFYNGKTIPAGKYTTTTDSLDTGTKFFGTARSNDYIGIKNVETGEQFLIKKNVSGTKGNIVSGLWADE